MLFKNCTPEKRSRRLWYSCMTTPMCNFYAVAIEVNKACSECKSGVEQRYEKYLQTNELFNDVLVWKIKGKKTGEDRVRIGKAALTCSDTFHNQLTEQGNGAAGK